MNKLPEEVHKLLRDHFVKLQLVELARKRVEDLQLTSKNPKSLSLGINRVIGRMFVDQLRRSRDRLRSQKIWVKDDPELSGQLLRYHFAYSGDRHILEISTEELNAAADEQVRELIKFIESACT